jgi:heme-degrading monooxygenase HmoA
MFGHIVLIKWKSQPTPAEQEHLEAGFRELAKHVPGLVSMRFGAYAGPPPSSAATMTNTFDFGVVSMYEDREAFNAFRSDSDHLRFGEEYILANLDQMMTFDFEA